MPHQSLPRLSQRKLFHLESSLTSKLGLDFFRSLPSSPGVYLFYGEDGKLLYVGQSSNLKARISSYRHVTPGQNPKRTLRLAHRIARIEWRECASTVDALELERDLLLKHRPPFNRAGVWHPDPWWLTVDVQPGRLQLDLTREEGGNGPLPSAFRHVYASLVRGVCRYAWPSAWMTGSPHGVFQPRIPLSHSLPVPDAAELAAEICAYAAGNSSGLLARLETIPAPGGHSEREYWAAELDRLRKWSNKAPGILRD